MAKRFLTSLKLVNLSVDPESSSAGEVYYNSSSNAIRYNDGSEWKNLGGDFSVESGSSYPTTNVDNGKFFYNTSSGRTAIHFDSVWKELAYVTDLPLNGGTAETTIFENSVDGGSPSDTVFVGVYDGGTP